MNTEPINHATFIVERTYPVSAAQVFRAFSDTDIKRRWFAEGEGWRVEEFTADFRPAGHETSRFRYRRRTADHQRHPLPRHRHRGPVWSSPT